MSGHYGDDAPPPEEPGDIQPSTWRAIDISAILGGTWVPPVPTVGTREDDQGLFYPGRVHSVASDSEGGKTWLALSAAADELTRGRGVVYEDHEDTEGTIVGRLMAMAVPREIIADRFRYLRPVEALHKYNGWPDLEAEVKAVDASLVIIDGVTEAMSAEGLDPNKNAEVAGFLDRLPRRVARLGPAVVMLDHVTKTPETRGRWAIGGVHKLNGLDGAAYLLENAEAFGLGRTGYSRLYVTKDRPGQLRQHAVRLKHRDWYADLVVINHGPELTEVRLAPPETEQPPAAEAARTPAEEAEGDRPDALMRLIAGLLADHPGMSRNEIEGGVKLAGGKRSRDAIRYAIRCLVDGGYVVLDPPEAVRGLAQRHDLARPYP